jgi:hypothetical protein
VPRQSSDARKHRDPAGRQTEGFIDVAHFAWIRHDSFADRENPFHLSARLEPVSGACG